MMSIAVVARLSIILFSFVMRSWRLSYAVRSCSHLSHWVVMFILCGSAKRKAVRIVARVGPVGDFITWATVGSCSASVFIADTRESESVEMRTWWPGSIISSSLILSCIAVARASA